MHLTHFAIGLQAQWLNEQLRGLTVADSFSQNRNEWMIMLARGGAAAGALRFNCDPQYPHAVFLPEARRRPNAAPVVEDIIGERIDVIGNPRGQRIIEIVFEEQRKKVMLQLFPHNANFFLLAEDGLVISTFKSAKKTPDFVPPPEEDEPEYYLFPALLEELQQVDAGLPLHKALRFRPAISAVMRNEILLRSGLDAEQKFGNLSQPGIKALAMLMADMIAEIGQQPARLYHDQEGYEILAWLALEQPHLTEIRQFANPNAALRAFCGQAIRRRDLAQSREKMSRALQRKIGKLEKTSEKLRMTRVDPQKQEMLNRKGQLLISQPHLLQAHQKKVTLVDYFHPDLHEVEIEVDPKLNARENAERYFRRAKQHGQKVQQYHQQGKSIEKQLSVLLDIREQLEAARSGKELAKIEEILLQKGVLQASPQQRESYRKPYREYLVNGFPVWIGRSARDNDQLTFRLAHKEDIWLHVQGYSGSHVIIRMKGSNSEFPPPEVLNSAARLAVTYSTARHASYLSVLYGRVKHVRKPRKASPGTVVTEQMKTTFADPLTQDELTELINRAEV